MMGERDWYARYKDARRYADEQAEAYHRGDVISNWRYVKDKRAGEPEPKKETLTGAAWVAWSYEIAADNARTLVDVQGKRWQVLVEVCEQLAAVYKEQA